MLLHFDYENKDNLSNCQIKWRDFLFLSLAKFLNVYRFHHFLTISHTGLLESLTTAQFFNHTCFFVFTFKFLEGFFDILAFFYLYYDHLF